MKRRNWIIGSLALATTLGLGGIGLAQACDGPGFMGGHHRQGGLKFVMHRLDLSTEQKDSIQKLFDEQQERSQAQRDNLRDIRTALREQVKSTQYDPAKVRELADQQAAIKAEMTVQRSETMHKIRQQLSAEQIAQLDSMAERRMNKKGHF